MKNILLILLVLGSASLPAVGETRVYHPIEVVACGGKLSPVEASGFVPRSVGEVNGQNVWRVPAPREVVQGIHEFSLASALGGATTSLKATINGKVVAVFPERDLALIEKQLKTDSNYPFKSVNTPLFPVTNRLLPRGSDRAKPLAAGKDFWADVEEIPVKMNLNNIASKEGAVAHHLHGLMFNQKALREPSYSVEGNTAFARLEYEDFFGGYWTSKAHVTVEQSLSSDGIFRFEMHARNIGSTPMPVGFGTHPYFQIPSKKASAVKLVIPSKRTAAIDDLENVLPTGEIVTLNDRAHPLNFNRAAPGLIEGKFIDNYFMLDPAQPAEVELIDQVAGTRTILRGKSSNIVGVQVFYPGKGDVIAIELVTNHPDPRRELWGSEPTGMQVLQPQESASYAYEIEIRPL